ncbi:MAG: hypothetical protein AB1722_04855 [Pseudomonadota bacterium]
MRSTYPLVDCLACLYEKTFSLASSAFPLAILTLMIAVLLKAPALA